MADWRDPIHPGEHLADELETIGMNGSELARQLDLPFNWIYQILRGERSITASTALRLGKFFSVHPEFWMNLQKSYDLAVTQIKERRAVTKVKPFRAPKGKQGSVAAVS